MNASVIAGALLSGLVLVASPLEAQRVAADVVIRGGPVAGRVVVGDGYSTYRRTTARRVVVVERVHRHRSPRHWKRHGFRPVTLFYVNGRYYDRWSGPRGPMREVVVYHRDGRYYHDCDHARGHRHDGWD